MRKDKSLNFVKLNIKWLVIGLLTLILGYVILGWNSTGSNSYEETVFAWHKLTLAPIVLLLGYTFIGLSLMLRSRK